MNASFLVGGYTASMQGSAAGIGTLAVRGPDAVLTFAGLAALASSPSFLAHGVASGVVYSVDEAAGRVEAFEPDGQALRHVGGRLTSGTFPCHLTATEDWLFVSNYGTGDIDVFPLAQDGSIGALHQTLAEAGSGPHEAQGGPHAHATLAVGDLVLSANLGTDRVGVHEWENGQLVRTRSIELPAGSGPRDFAVTDGRVFLLGELSGVVFELGGLDTESPHTVRSAKCTPTPTRGDHAAGLVLGHDGQHLYAGLRGSNRIAVLRTNDLTAVADVDCGGDWPRHLAVRGDRLYVACQLSNTVTTFAIDERTGIPRFIATQPVPSPTYLLPPRES